MRTDDRTRGRPGIAIGLGALVFLAGMAARGALTHPAPANATRPVAQATAGPGPSGAVAGMPVGYAHSRDGARAAALSFASVVPQRALYLSRDQVTDAVRGLAADGARDALTAQVLADFDRAQPLLAASDTVTWWAVASLAVHVDAYTPDRARVSVWVTHVLSKQGVAAPQSSWATVTVELVWERDDWRIWSQTTAPGPTPALDASDVPATAAGLDQRLAGFELVDPAPK